MKVLFFFLKIGDISANLRFLGKFLLRRISSFQIFAKIGLQSNLCIMTTWGMKFLQLLETGDRYKEDLCITAKTVNSNIWLSDKGIITFHLIIHDTDKNKSACIFV